MSEAEHIRKSRIRSAINKRMESFVLNKDHTIRSVLECPFCKVTLDHLVMDNELVLESDLVKTKMDVIIERWTRKYNVVSVVSNPLEYVFDDAFSDVMCPIDFDKMSGVISNLPDRKAASLSVLMIPKPYEWKSVLMNTCPIVLIEITRKILSKILSDRISFACSKFDVLRGDNFSVLKDMTTQSPIFTIGSVIEDALEKNSYNSVGWEHLKESLVRIKMCDKFIWFFGGIHNSWVNRVMTDFGLTNGYQVHDSLDQEERQESVCKYRLDSHFMTRNSLTSFLAAGAFVDDTIWVSSSQTAMQHILNITSEFFQINNILINNDKMVVIPINCRVSKPCLLISGLPISIAKKGESHWYLGIFLSTKGLSKPSLARTYLDVQFFTNLMLRKAVSDKQFSYLVLAILYPIIAYRTQFSFVSINVCGLKSKSGLPCDFPNNAIYHSSLYGLKSFKQIQAESKSASVVGFANSVGILGHLFVYRLHDLQIFLEYNLSLSGFVTNAFYFPSRTLMFVILGEPTFYNCVFLLRHYGIAFVEQLHSFPHWFDVFVCYLNDSGLPSVCDSLLPCDSSSNILKSHEFEVVCNHLLRVDSGRLFLFMDDSLSGLGTLGMKAGAAVFFEDINLGLGVGVSRLVSSTMVELQAIALALECIPPSHLVDLFSNSQAALDVCKSEFLLTCLDFRNWCWIEHHYIVDIIQHKNLNVNWVKVKDYSGVLRNKHADAFARAITFSNMYLPHIINEHFLKADGIAVSSNSRYFVFLVDRLCADVDWSKSSLVWHLDFYLAAGFTSAQTAGFYSSVICLFCGDIEVLDHVFSCPFDAAGCAWLVEIYASAWEAHSGLSCSSLCVLQLLFTCFSNVGVDTTLCKGFVFKKWYCKSVTVFRDFKIAAQNIMAFVHEFCLVFHDDVWLVHAKHWVIMEKDGMILCNSSISVSVSGLFLVLLASVIRLLDIADAFGVRFGFCKSCLFFSGLGDMVLVHISA
ncbi:hypothetical protein G9A89_013208 [Geosiphon pyriformis]|nr:hypothetical protein G9A89_013208 [Geosiphon pyriformis]